MKKHTKIYLKEMGYTIADFIPCELCGEKAVDIHHIDARGMGGSKEKDHIDNLMALCRDHHERFGDIRDLKEWLKERHQKAMEKRSQELNQWTVFGSGKQNTSSTTKSGSSSHSEEINTK